MSIEAIAGLFALLSVLATLAAIYGYLQYCDMRAKYDELLTATGCNDFTVAFDSMTELIHRWACAKGFWEEGSRRNKGEVIALIHSEASELLENVRRRPKTGVEVRAQIDNEMEELADIVIRCMDYSAGFRPGLSLGNAIHTKMLANIRRPHKHGKRF